MLTKIFEEDENGVKVKLQDIFPFPKESISMNKRMKSSSGYLKPEPPPIFPLPAIEYRGTVYSFPSQELADASPVFDARCLPSVEYPFIFSFKDASDGVSFDCTVDSPILSYSANNQASGSTASVTYSSDNNNIPLEYGIGYVIRITLNARNAEGLTKKTYLTVEVTFYELPQPAIEYFDTVYSFSSQELADASPVTRQIKSRLDMSDPLDLTFKDASGAHVSYDCTVSSATLPLSYSAVDQSIGSTQSISLATTDLDYGVDYVVRYTLMAKNAAGATATVYLTSVVNFFIAGLKYQGNDGFMSAEEATDNPVEITKTGLTDTNEIDLTFIDASRGSDGYNYVITAPSLSFSDSGVGLPGESKILSYQTQNLSYYTPYIFQYVLTATSGESSDSRYISVSVTYVPDQKQHFISSVFATFFPNTNYAGRGWRNIARINGPAQGSSFANVCVTQVLANASIGIPIWLEEGRSVYRVGCKLFGKSAGMSYSITHIETGRVSSSVALAGGGVEMFMDIRRGVELPTYETQLTGLRYVNFSISSSGGFNEIYTLLPLDGRWPQSQDPSETRKNMWSAKQLGRWTFPKDLSDMETAPSNAMTSVNFTGENSFFKTGKFRSNEDSLVQELIFRGYTGLSTPYGSTASILPQFTSSYVMDCGRPNLLFTGKIRISPAVITGSSVWSWTQWVTHLYNRHLGTANEDHMYNYDLDPNTVAIVTPLQRHYSGTRYGSTPTTNSVGCFVSNDDPGDPMSFFGIVCLGNLNPYVDTEVKGP